MSDNTAKLEISTKAKRPAWIRFRARRKYDKRKAFLQNYGNWWYENGGREKVQLAARDLFLYGITPEGMDPKGFNQPFPSFKEYISGEKDYPEWPGN